MSGAGYQAMPFKPSLLSDEAPRLGKAPAACWGLSEARGRFTLSLAQSTDGGGGSGSSAHRNQGAPCLEDSPIAWSWLTRPNKRPALVCSISCRLHFERLLLAASEAGRSAA